MYIYIHNIHTYTYMCVYVCNMHTVKPTAHARLHLLHARLHLLQAALVARAGRKARRRRIRRRARRRVRVCNDVVPYAHHMRNAISSCTARQYARCTWSRARRLAKRRARRRFCECQRQRPGWRRRRRPSRASAAATSSAVGGTPYSVGPNCMIDGASHNLQNNSAQ